MNRNFFITCHGVIASLALLGLNAVAAPAGYLGEVDCRIVAPSVQAGLSAKWEGACKDGYANGQGFLTWFVDGKQQDLYEGLMARGQPHGKGHLFTATGTHLVGIFEDGKLQGAGMRVDADGNKLSATFEGGQVVGPVNYTNKDGNRYQGGWDTQKDGRSGHGIIEYATGGSYEGEWLDDKAVGIGTVTYPNGIKRTGLLTQNNPLTDNKEAPRFYITDDFRSGFGLLPELIKGLHVPPHAAYSEMTLEAQAFIRAQHPILQADDVPPYLQNGNKKLLKEFVKGTPLFGKGGLLRLNILIEADGTPSTVVLIKTPNPDIAEYLAMLLKREKYTPAKCAGQPCAMSMPFSFTLGGS